MENRVVCFLYEYEMKSKSSSKCFLQRKLRQKCCRLEDNSWDLLLLVLLFESSLNMKLVKLRNGEWWRFFSMYDEPGLCLYHILLLYFEGISKVWFNSGSYWPEDIYLDTVFTFHHVLFVTNSKLVI